MLLPKVRGSFLFLFAGSAFDFHYKICRTECLLKQNDLALQDVFPHHAIPKDINVSFANLYRFVRTDLEQRNLHQRFTKNKVLLVWFSGG